MAAASDGLPIHLFQRERVPDNENSFLSALMLSHCLNRGMAVPSVTQLAVLAKHLRRSLIRYLMLGTTHLHGESLIATLNFIASLVNGRCDGKEKYFIIDMMKCDLYIYAFHTTELSTLDLKDHIDKKMGSCAMLLAQPSASQHGESQYSVLSMLLTLPKRLKLRPVLPWKAADFTHHVPEDFKVTYCGMCNEKLNVPMMHVDAAVGLNHLEGECGLACLTCPLSFHNHCLLSWRQTDDYRWNFAHSVLSNLPHSNLNILTTTDSDLGRGTYPLTCPRCFGYTPILH